MNSLQSKILLPMLFVTTCSFCYSQTAKQNVVIFNPTGIEDTSTISIVKQSIQNTLIESKVFNVYDGENIHIVCPAEAIVCITTIRRTETPEYFVMIHLLNVKTGKSLAEGVGISTDINSVGICATKELLKKWSEQKLQKQQ